MDLRKKLIFSTAAAALLVLIVMVWISIYPKCSSTKGSSPVFGSDKAPVEVILFEDLKCHGCRTFFKQVLPRIESDYLISKRIRLKVVPLGFLTGSKVLANAALEVYRLFPEGFLPFVNTIFDRFEFASIGESTGKVLLEFAEEVGRVDLVQLKACIDQKCHYSELDRNLTEAKALMGKKFRIPALYVNGVRVNTTDYESIQQEIERATR
jgi:protein-disulfide isomerase